VNSTIKFFLYIYAAMFFASIATYIETHNFTPLYIPLYLMNIFYAIFLIVKSLDVVANPLLD